MHTHSRIALTKGVRLSRLFNQQRRVPKVGFCYPTVAGTALEVLQFKFRRAAYLGSLQTHVVIDRVKQLLFASQIAFGRLN
jgi:hypothetical protein